MIVHGLPGVGKDTPVAQSLLEERVAACGSIPLAAWLQVLEEDVQTSPVADVQAPEVPQTQGAGLAVAPSPWAQAGPVKAAHRQALEL